MFAIVNATRIGADLWNGWQHRRWLRQAAAACDASDALRSCDDAQLRRKAAELSWSIRSPHRPGLRQAAYALVRETARRVHNQAHFEVQMLAGLAASSHAIVEMQTGEGKTLAALLPAFWHALGRQGCHVVTANDYLAARDAEFARPLFEFLGCTVGCIREEMPRDERRREYGCDITFGTAKEFGFDFLRDRMMCELGEPPVQRGTHAAVIDEADSVLIDDARTPLLISTPAGAETGAEPSIQWSGEAASSLRMGLEFICNIKQRRAQLTNAGCERLMRMRKEQDVRRIGSERLFEQVEHALTALHLLHADQDYVVSEHGVELVDGSTGRVAAGRRWRQGLHQAVEAKEGVELSETTGNAARITVQRYFQRYRHLCGLTGTAMPSAGEFRRVYGTSCFVVPTRKPCQRKSVHARVFATMAGKHDAVVEDARRRAERGQAVLIGTPSVAASERLAQKMSDEMMPHTVLNCRRHRQEAQIVAQAGQAGRVTIATNMAGRGTDIKVASEVLALGGLHVIATERHANQRIDRQLIGRAARQGEPGSYQFLVSLEDELLQDSGESHSRRGSADGDELPSNWMRVFDRAQARTARRHARDRVQLLQHEKERDRKCAEIGLDPILDLAFE